MNTVIDRLLDADPSKVIGWVIAVLAAVGGFLATLTPALQNVQGWGDAAVVIIIAALPKFTAALIALRAYTPDTVKRVKAQAHTEGKETAIRQVKVARSMAAQKGAETRASKVGTPELESVADPKPPVKKRSTRKQPAIPPTTKSRTSK